MSLIFVAFLGGELTFVALLGQRFNARLRSVIHPKSD